MIDFWCKPDDLTDPLVTRLGLQNLVRLSDLNLDLIPADKKEYTHLISIVGTQNDLFHLIDFASKYKVQYLSVVTTEVTFNRIDKTCFGVDIKYFINLSQ